MFTSSTSSLEEVAIKIGLKEDPTKLAEAHICSGRVVIVVHSATPPHVNFTSLYSLGLNIRHNTQR